MVLIDPPVNINADLPVADIYRDIGKPGAIQVGQLIEDVMKTTQLAVFPIQVLAAVQDRVRTFVDRSIKQIPPERLIPPPLQILEPTLESIRFEPKNTDIEQLFLDLLSNSMDSQYAEKVHPAYPKLLQQLSSDEAIILKTLKESEGIKATTEADLLLDQDRGHAGFANFKTIQNTFPLDKLRIPSQIAFYVSHLHTMGLASLFIENQEPILKEDKQTGTRITEVYKLTVFGRAFITACLRE